jgi:hypothetical protein
MEGSDMSRTIDVIFDRGVLRPVQPLMLQPNREYAITIQDLDEADAPPATPATDPDATDGDDLVSSAWRIYNQRLKAILEPDHLGKVVAIQPDSAEYEVANNSPTARKALRERCPRGSIVTLRIGVVDDDNPLSLRARNAIRGLRS